jgi:hypothetical protein
VLDNPLSFVNRQPGCQIISFPADRRIGKIRAAASGIDRSRSAKEATDRWRRSVTALEVSLQKAGIPPLEIAQETDRFLVAVDRELFNIFSDWRLIAPSEAPDLGGAA